MKIRAFLALLLTLSILLPALGQTQPATTTQPQKPSDDKDDVVRITTNLVQVDAVVTKDGKQVRNLTVDDFEIFEDGRRQTITSFAYISNVPATASQPAAPVREKGKEVVPFPPLKRNDPRRTIALVVDDLGLSAESMSQVRSQLRKFVAQKLQPNDLVAIIRSSGELGALQQFTNDRRLLNRSVDQLRWNMCSRIGIHVLPSQGQRLTQEYAGTSCGQSSNTFGSLHYVLDAMAELPGRKSLVLLSDSLLQDESQEVNFNNNSIMQSPGLRRRSLNYSYLLNRIAEKAIRSSVVIYSVDTQGLQYTGITAADSFRPLAGLREITAQTQRLMSERSQLLFDRRRGGALISRQTGGFQIRNSNNYGLDRILEDQSGYYLLGYRPTAETFNKSFHHITAKVKRSGMTLRTRFGFFGVSEEEATRPRPSTRDETNLALTSPFGAQDIDLNLTSFFSNTTAAGSVIRSFVYIDPKDVSFTELNGRHNASIELHGVIFGDNGSVVEKVSRAASLSLSESDYEKAKSSGIGVSMDLVVKLPGSYQVRVAARDKTTSRIGSAGQFVLVPNLRKKRMAVSGIVLGTGRESTGTGGTIAKPGLRHFQANSDLYFAFMIYNAALDKKRQPQNLVMETTLFRDSKSVYSGPEVPIGTANQPDPNRLFADGVVKLGAGLEPGHYYLQVAISDRVAGKKKVPLVQWVDFEVVK